MLEFSVSAVTCIQIFDGLRKDDLKKENLV